MQPQAIQLAPERRRVARHGEHVAAVQRLRLHAPCAGALEPALARHDDGVVERARRRQLAQALGGSGLAAFRHAHGIPAQRALRHAAASGKRRGCRPTLRARRVAASVLRCSPCRLHAAFLSRNASATRHKATAPRHQGRGGLFAKLQKSTLFCNFEISPIIHIDFCITAGRLAFITRILQFITQWQKSVLFCLPKMSFHLGKRPV